MADTIKKNDIIKALTELDEQRNINPELVIEAFKEALAKAYIRYIDAPDAIVRVEMDNKYGFHLYHDLEVVAEDSGYEELEIPLEKARLEKPDIKVGDLFTREIEISKLGYAAILKVKNILKQKVREAEKQAIYDEYIDQKGEMVIGFIESVEEKFCIVNIGKTLALMPKSQQIPNEIYREGDKIRVLILDVKRDTKGAQVLVSRADATLVKRLFEKEVPEIFQGVVEIKAIAREAGERTKMAVYSKNLDVDPVGACIGPRGARIQAIIEELKGEKIDVFVYSDNIAQLVKNALAPAELIGCFYNEENRLVVVVEDDKLSLAIGKRGKNAKLAVKLLGCRIDIKTRSEMAEAGIDFEAKYQEFLAQQAELEALKQQELLQQAQAAIAQKRAESEAIEENFIEDELEDELDEEEVVEEVSEEETSEPTSEPEKVEVVEETIKPRKIEELKPRTDYVSKFEELADASSRNEKTVAKKKKRKKDDEERKLRPEELNTNKEYEFKPEYSEDELLEIENAEYEQEMSKWDDDIDFDDYDSYYDEEN